MTTPTQMVGQIAWKPQEGVSGTKVLKPTRSLVISPNLDALLEYDEKIRGSRLPASPESPQSAPPTSTSLPPPPRRNSRKPRSPTSPKIASPLIQETFTWQESENPYINPAPELGDLIELTRSDGIPIGPKLTDGEKCSVTDVVEETSQPSQASRRRVDKGFGIGRLPFGLFNDASAKTEDKTQQLDDSYALNTNRGHTGLRFRERVQTKVKLLKLTGVPDRRRMHQANDRDDMVLDIRRHSTDSVGGLDSFRRRPFLSHGRPSSQGSTSTSSSYSSISTHDPASTVDAHISISSTMYPSSTVQSHGLFADEPLPIVPPNRSSSLYTDYSARRSFIDITSPDVAEFTLPDHPPSPSPPSDHKPLVPTTTTLNFNRASEKLPQRNLPPTTNFLDLDERIDLIKSNRKLAQVFGQPPGPDVFPQTRSLPPVLPKISTSHQRIPSLDVLLNQTGVWHSATVRSHSEPLSPEDGFLLDRQKNSSRPTDLDTLASRTSFMDLSDDLNSGTPKDAENSVSGRDRGRRPLSPSAQSLFESMSPEEQAEELRRRKREKLARLHRFLGSRVPTDLILGPNFPDPVLPPPLEPTQMFTDPPESRKDWLRRRRSSSAAAYGPSWSDELDRMKEDLNSTEKAINVRRAQKMEKVFGVAPPQTLFHTRRSPSPSVSNVAVITGQKMVSGWTSPGESLPPVTGIRNPNRSSYAKSKRTKDNRPGTSESNKALLPKGPEDSREPDLRRRPSVVYSHYQDSLNSLNDIIDRDDRESLAELHEYLNSGDMFIPPPLQTFTRSSPKTVDRRLSNASSIKSERRRSLPARTSIISVSSDYTISSPRPDVTDFQARRKRAAKLTQFFGVDYRVLITDVLESIENGLEHERNRGTLNADEVEDLLASLRKLRTKRPVFT
ncbi:hypothetical protein H0H93_005771 [Arthromyces matolae]|nr:hypothetical protein H0H93_005771 [Arthromyces matolae]